MISGYFFEMHRALTLCALLGVTGIASAAYGSGGNNGNNGQAGINCPAQKYRVEGIVAAPYLSAADANGKNSGFIIEMLELMKSASNGTFDYSLTVQAANSYPGLVDDLVSNKADIAAADFEVRSERHAVIDFLQPFLRTQTRIAVNNANGVLVGNPTYYVLDDFVLVSVLLASSNATLNGIITSAQAANRVLNLDAGVAALLADSSPKAFIGVTPQIAQAVQQHSGQLSLLPDVLETAYFAFGIQQNHNDIRLCLNILQLKIQETGQLQTLRNKYNLN